MRLSAACCPERGSLVGRGRGVAQNQRIPHVSGGSLAWAMLGRAGAGQDIGALLPVMRCPIEGTTD
jgi:hypothetical protein